MRRPSRADCWLFAAFIGLALLAYYFSGPM
jgi:hypothetical protein